MKHGSESPLPPAPEGHYWTVENAHWANTVKVYLRKKPRWSSVKGRVVLNSRNTNPDIMSIYDTGRYLLREYEKMQNINKYSGEYE